MLQIMEPAVAHRMYYRTVGTVGVDPRGVGYLWDPKLGPLVPLGQLEHELTIPCIASFGYAGFFKPSLAEVLASIRTFTSDWRAGIRYFVVRTASLLSLSDVHVAHIDLYSAPSATRIADTARSSDWRRLTDETAVDADYVPNPATVYWQTATLPPPPPPVPPTPKPLRMRR